MELKELTQKYLNRSAKGRKSWDIPKKKVGKPGLPDTMI